MNNLENAPPQYNNLKPIIVVYLNIQDKSAEQSRRYFDSSLKYFQSLDIEKDYLVVVIPVTDQITKVEVIYSRGTNISKLDMKDIIK